MARDHEQDLDEHLERFSRRLPAWAARLIDWLWKPGLWWVRLPLGIVLILGGIVGFLPILGFWMVPLGLDRQFNRVILAGGALNLVLAVMLAPRFAQIGMAAAVVATEIFVTLALYSTLRRRGLSPLAGGENA